MIPAEAVEAAAKAMYASQYADPFERVSPATREEFLEMARAALEATATFLPSQACSEKMKRLARFYPPHNEDNEGEK